MILPKLIVFSGYMLVHSTLTNALTREWLERVRRGVGRSRPDSRGVEGGVREGGCGLGFSNMSFLEPHKMFQNSFSIFQKRDDVSGQYEEPVLTRFP